MQNLTPSLRWNKAIDHIFNNSLSDIIGADFTSTEPSVNIVENEDGYIITLAAPGMQKKDFDIQLKDNQLVIKAETTSDATDNRPETLRREFAYNSFKRSFRLPDTIDESKISARYKLGLLTVTLQYKDETSIHTKIDIK